MTKPVFRVSDKARLKPARVEAHIPWYNVNQGNQCCYIAHPRSSFGIANALINAPTDVPYRIIHHVCKTGTLQIGWLVCVFCGSHAFGGQLDWLILSLDQAPSELNYKWLKREGGLWNRLFQEAWKFKNWNHRSSLTWCPHKTLDERISVLRKNGCSQ